MISQEMMRLMQQSVENEFNIAAELYDTEGNALTGQETANPQMLAKEKTTVTIKNGDKISGFLRLPTSATAQKTEAVRLFVSAMASLSEKGLAIDKTARAESFLVSRMVGEDAHIYHDDIVAYGADLGYRIDHPIAVVVAYLEGSNHHCLNISFGYESATNDAKHHILKLVKEHPYMNKQDIVAFTQDKYLVVLKTINDLSDISAIYRVVDKLSEMLSEILSSYRIFRYYIAPGEVVETFDDAHLVYQDALRNISYAKKMNIDHPIIRQEDVLYHHLIAKLPGRMRVDVVEQKVKLLLSQNREMVSGLVECFEAFINNGFNITNTAYEAYLHRNTVKKRLDKLYRLTGFDPMGSFEDVMMNKMILYQYMAESREQEL